MPLSTFSSLLDYTLKAKLNMRHLNKWYQDLDMETFLLLALCESCPMQTQSHLDYELLDSKNQDSVYLGVPFTWKECKVLFIWLMLLLNLNARSFSIFIRSSNMNWRPTVCPALCLMLKGKAAVAELLSAGFHIKCHDVKKRGTREAPHL